MNKKAITILGAIFLLIVGTIGFLIYQKRSKGTNTPPPATVSPTPPPAVEPTPSPTEEPTPIPTDEPIPTPTEEPAPPVSNSGVVKLTDSEVLSHVLFYQGNGEAFL